jgi:hypothetical protein
MELSGLRAFVTRDGDFLNVSKLENGVAIIRPDELLDIIQRFYRLLSNKAHRWVARDQDTNQRTVQPGRSFPTCCEVGRKCSPLERRHARRERFGWDLRDRVWFQRHCWPPALLALSMEIQLPLYFIKKEGLPGFRHQHQNGGEPAGL